MNADEGHSRRAGSRTRAEPVPLPLAGRPSGWERQRGAAAQNHQAVLAAARQLFRQHGVAVVDVRQVARAAGVGVGTVYRRFGNKANLIAAVIDERERDLQEGILRGPPPLGPGANPDRRLEAFLRALCQLTGENLDLIYASESAAEGGRYAIGAYSAWRQHLALLVAEIAPEVNPGWYADLLLAPLSGSLYRYHREVLGLSDTMIAGNVIGAARRLLTSEAVRAAPRRRAATGQ